MTLVTLKKFAYIMHLQPQTRNRHTYTGTIIRLQDGALFGNQIGQAKIVHTVLHLQFSTNQPSTRLELKSNRKISEIYGYKKYVAQMHIYWIPEMFPSLARNYERVFGT